MKRPRIDYAELLDVFLWGLDKMMRPTFYNLVMGYEEYAHHKASHGLVKRLQAADLVRQEGRGAQACFSITPVARQRLRETDLEVFWRQPWDGAWRVVTFDVPESRRHERKLLWQALRARKLGLLQRSVWIWPHAIEPILKEIMRVDGLPECFCGFEARKLFLCTDAEIVAAAWGWTEIGRRQQSYLDQPSVALAALDGARHLPDLATLARAERRAYEAAFLFDPLLPVALLPVGYRGREVRAHHLRFRQRLNQRFARLARETELASK